MILVGAVVKVMVLPPVSVTLMGKVALGWPEAPPDELESPPQAATRRPRRAAPRKARSQGLFALPGRGLITALSSFVWAQPGSLGPVTLASRKRKPRLE